MFTAFKTEKHDKLAQIKKEQRHYKTFFKSKFLNNLNELLDMCFAPAKDKKEQFITKEKLTLQFLQLLQAQRKFRDDGDLQKDITSTAVLDKSTCLCGRILTINMVDHTVEYITLHNLREKLPAYVKSFSDVEFFDPRSMKMDAYWRLQCRKFASYDYKTTFTFLTGKLEEANIFKALPSNSAIKYSMSDIDNKIKVHRYLMERDISD